MSEHLHVFANHSTTSSVSVVSALASALASADAAESDVSLVSSELFEQAASIETLIAATNNITNFFFILYLLLT